MEVLLKTESEAETQMVAHIVKITMLQKSVNSKPQEISLKVAQLIEST